ncbi:hypothetical protein IKL45_00610 [Candidatus Saccharibacteria bacterium]|nr:hypothetical protein [Candidatus Saccharibacteria bacterium]MBR6122934.1 hypothetical protein [Candidatus Saccharibacteria bacterium]
MGGKQIKHLTIRLKKLRAVKTWQLFLIFILLLFVSATLLRLDHIKMTNLRSAVLAADKEGNEIVLADALNQLKDFTVSHTVVNIVDDNGDKKLEFGTGVFYLEQSYLTAASEILQKASEAEIDDDNPNGNVYALASAVCRPLAIANGWSWNSPEHIACWQAELAKYPATSAESDTIRVSLPSTELYRREYVSPIWTPSLSGFVILATLILGVVIFIRLLIWICLEITLIIMKNA